MNSNYADLGGGASAQGQPAVYAEGTAIGPIGISARTHRQLLSAVFPLGKCSPWEM